MSKVATGEEFKERFQMTGEDFANASTVVSVIFEEILAISKDTAEVIFGGLLVWKGRQTERTMEQRNGWFYITQDEFEHNKLTRTKIDRVRKRFAEIGVIEYKRAGVFGRRFFKVNWQRLTDLIEAKIKNKDHIARMKKIVQRDRDDFAVPDFIPLNLWHAFLDMRTAKNGKQIQGKQDKIKWVKQLAKLNHQITDLAAFMKYVLHKGWSNFIMYSTVKWEEVTAIGAIPVFAAPPLSEEPPPKYDGGAARNQVLNLLRIKK